MKELFDNFYSACGYTEESAPDSTTMNPSDTTDCDAWVLEKVGYAQAYIPFQKFEQISETEQGLACGTVFPELVMPFKKGTGLANN